MLTPILTQFISALVCVTYGSFFEWFWHKHWMHHPREPKEAFRGHTIVHHGLYRGDDSYFVAENEHAEHVLLKPYALPALLLSHLPLIWLFDRYVIHNTAIGAIAATLLYFIVYEWTHYNMHVPRKSFLERYEWFQFLRRHHHLHHRYMQKNFCVLNPFADWCMGTMATEASLARQKAAREAALASGAPLPERKERKRRVRAGS